MSGSYMKAPPLKRQFECIGALPAGDWKFCAIQIQGQADALVIADMKGQHAPRMVIDGKLKVLEIE